MRAFVVMGVVAVALAGCGLSPEYRAQQQLKLQAETNATCRQVGAKSDDQYFQCRLALETQRRNEAATYGAVDAAIEEQRTQDFANRLIYGPRVR